MGDVGPQASERGAAGRGARGAPGRGAPDAPTRTAAMPVLAWGLVAAVLGSWCLAALAVATGLAPARPPGAEPLATGADPHVVLVGIPGLTWDLVDRAPTLADLAGSGGSAALVLRGTPEVSCAGDAWLTVGAGERAGDADRAAGSGCAADEVLPALDDSRLAELAEAGGTCVQTSGPGWADEAGLLDEPTIDPACRIHLVQGTALLEGDRAGLLGETDAALAALLEKVPPGSTVVVSGMGQTAGRPDAQALIVSQPAPTLLSSGSTRQAGLAQLTDLTPTLLDLAGVDADEPGLTAAPITRVTRAGPALVGAPAVEAADLADAVSDAQRLAPWTLGALAVLLLPPLALGAALRRRPLGRRLLSGSAATVMATPVAAFLVGLVPWWRASQPWPVLTVAIAGTAAVLAALALFAARGSDEQHAAGGRGPLVAPALIATVTLMVLGVDTIWSSRLGLVSVLGLQPVTAGRFYGQGNVGFGMLLGAVLVLMAALLSWLPPPSRRGAVASAASAVALLGGGAMVLGAAPQAGADFGSVPAMAVTTGLVLLAALGIRWTVRSLLLVVGGALVLAALAMVLDWLRGPDQRTHLGAFVQAMIDGDALDIVTRKLDQSVGILVRFPLSWLAVLALIALAVLVVRRPPRSARLWQEPGVAPVAAAAVVGMAVAWALNDSGIAAVALCLTLVLAAGVMLLTAGPPRSAAERGG